MAETHVAMIYKRAWRIFQGKIRDGKTSYGKNELQTLMAQCLEWAFDEQERADET